MDHQKREIEPLVSAERDTNQGATSQKQDEQTFPVVAIGASAGGLEALEKFFEQAPVKSGMAYVVVQHLSPDFKSMMDELLRRRTSIPIKAVTDGMVLLPDYIYLMPPRKEMILSGGRLLLTDKDLQEAFALPIDRFFRSVAQDVGNRGVAVILSGTGSDGSRGLREIHDAGGLVIVQSEESSKFDGMPRSARETGMVDMTLPPDEMAKAILGYFRRDQDSEKDYPVTVPEDGVQVVFRHLRNDFGIDFNQYKPSTVARRIERRMLLGHYTRFEDYVERIVESPKERSELYHDLLIGVTRFFRDPEAFERLGGPELQGLLERAAREGEEFRVWVAGCATGEEPYSIAMMLHEMISSMKNRPEIRIFATDVHRTSLEFASIGLYDKHVLESVSPERLENYFIPKGDDYQIIPTLRKMIVFAPHDLTKDAPFTRLDLVCCRNLLIYFQQPVQKRVITLFHFSLRTGGILFQGPSETPGELADEFECLDDRWKIAIKRRDARLRPDPRMSLSLASHQRPRELWQGDSFTADRQRQAVYDRLLEEHLPPSFLINSQRELLHSFGGAGRYLTARDGRVSRELLELIDPQLRAVVLGGLTRSEKNGAAVVLSGVRYVCFDRSTQTLKVLVKPFKDRLSSSSYFLVVIEPTQVEITNGSAETAYVDAAPSEQLQDMEYELRYTRESLQAMIEEQESSNEELQATNEELVASNEELQSTNEELHSVNEELYTVNAEYQRKIDELTRMTADIENLLQSTDLGVIFLDQKLRVRMYTPRVSEYFQLLQRDLGRPISAFTHTLSEPIEPILHKVLRDERAIELEIQDHAGKCLFLRALPYRLESGEADGVVLTIIDISALKSAEARLRHLSAIVESSADAIVSKDLDGNIITWNHGAEALYGYTAEEVLGKPLKLLYTDEDRANLDATLDRIRTGVSVTEECRRRRKDGQVIQIQHTISPIMDVQGKVVGASGIARDITARKRAEEETLSAIRHRDQFLAMLSHELRNPLGAVLNAIYVLERQAPTEGMASEAYDVIRRQADQMARLLDDLLDVTRITQHKIELRRHECDLVDVVRDAIQNARSMAEGRKQQLTLTVDDRHPIVFGDSARLQQVVVNLVRNAVKYGPMESKIDVWVGVRDGQGEIVVEDNGVGIPADMLDRIFELFVQSRETLDRSDGGIGVGLTLVKSIIELHGGTVVAESEGADKGSLFRVRLPLCQAPNDVQPTPPPVTHKPQPGLRIVLVEDKEDSRTMLSSLLRLDGYEVFDARDGIAGLAAIKRYAPDVAVVDIGLPGLDGYQIARTVRLDPKTKNVYLIALTGYGQASDRKAALNAGFNAHLVKPLNLAELYVELGKQTQSKKSTKND